MRWLLLALLGLVACQGERPCKCGYGRAEDGLCYPVQDPDGTPACASKDTADTADTAG